MIGNRQRYRHLAIGLLAQLTAILVVHADRMVRSGWVRQDEIVLRVQSY
jgi:hypothetical protein